MLRETESENRIRKKVSISSVQKAKEMTSADGSKGRSVVLRTETKTHRTNLKGSCRLQQVGNLASSDHPSRNGLRICEWGRSFLPPPTCPLNHDNFLRKQDSDHGAPSALASEELTDSFRKHLMKQLFVCEQAQTFWGKLCLKESL